MEHFISAERFLHDECLQVMRNGECKIQDWNVL